MSGQRSLRSRLLFGNVLWSLGLAVFIALLSTAMVLHVHLSGWQIHFGLLGVTAIGFIIAGLAQLHRGMAPFNVLRERLIAVRDGRTRRVGGSYPAEIQPLIQDLNALLDDRDERVTRAIAKAGDLAHGLKTPLAVLAQEGERAEAAGQHELAATIEQQVTRMRRQIEYHLVHARAAASGGAKGAARSSLKESADGLARTLLRLHADRGLTISVDVPADQHVRVQREDLDEMLGNLLDNACKWARGRVRLSSSVAGDVVTILVDDDGAGLDPSKRQVVLQRGVRVDEASPGSGLGLAIVRDLAELYGGSIALEQSPDGGVRARLTLPHVST
jgi:signal transduction histidine kinase